MRKLLLLCLVLLCLAPTPAVNITAYDITSGTGTGLTVNNVGEMVRQVHKVTTTFAAFSAAALTADKTIATLPAKTRLCALYADVTQTFSGGTVATATLSLGTSAGGLGLILAADVKTAVVTLGLLDADLGASVTRAASIQGCYVPSWSGTTILSARITTTVGNTSALTQGSITWYIVTEVLP